MMKTEICVGSGPIKHGNRIPRYYSIYSTKQKMDHISITFPSKRNRCIRVHIYIHGKLSSVCYLTPCLQYCHIQQHSFNFIPYSVISHTHSLALRLMAFNVHMLVFPLLVLSLFAATLLAYFSSSECQP